LRRPFASVFAGRTEEHGRRWFSAATPAFSTIEPADSAYTLTITDALIRRLAAINGKSGTSAGTCKGQLSASRQTLLRARWFAFSGCLTYLVWRLVANGCAGGEPKMLRVSVDSGGCSGFACVKQDTQNPLPQKRTKPTPFSSPAAPRCGQQQRGDASNSAAM
jgi:hypothetical protein